MRLPPRRESLDRWPTFLMAGGLSLVINPLREAEAMLEIDLLEPGYARLLCTIADWAEAHGSIQAMFVSGSVAEGTADAFSDLDLVVVVNQPNCTALLDELRTVIDDAEPVVLDYRLGGDVLCLITEEWHRIDLVFGGSDSGILDRVLIPVFDPDDLYDGAASEETLEPATADDVIELAMQFLRVLALSAVVHGRKDVHVGHDGADLLRHSLVELLLMEPPRRARPGAKKLLPVLTDEQQSVLKDLPPVADHLELLNAYNAAVASVFLPRARELTEALGGVWPIALERATRTHLRGTIEM